MEASSIGRGLGCLAVLPAAFIGLAGLTDGVGPTGWRGFAELFGWATACFAASYCFGLLFTPKGWPKAWRYPVGVALVVAMTLTVNWLGLGAPMAAKITFTSGLQVLGVIAAVLCLVALINAMRGGRERY